MKPLLLLSFCCALGGLAGCGPPQRTTYPVSGTVNWQGEPVPAGDILFDPVDGGIPDSGKIVNGSFAFQATAGPKWVRIHATRGVGPADPVMGAPREEAYIPPRFNHQSELREEVRAEGENRFEFHLGDGPAGRRP